MNTKNAGCPTLRSLKGGIGSPTAWDLSVFSVVTSKKRPENGVGALHQKWALTLAPLEPSFKMSPLATAKTQPHPAAQQRP